MVLIFDNLDSFTYNLVQLVEAQGKEVRVITNDIPSPSNDGLIQQIQEIHPECIIISPGPGRPEKSHQSIEIIKSFYKTLPILGVCLGLQCIASAFDVSTGPAKRMLHGMTTPVYHNNSTLFRKVATPFEAARYHSLSLTSLPMEFKLTAWDKKDEILAIEHQLYPLFGVQFHPESFMTPQGEAIIQNFLNSPIPVQHKKANH